MGGVVETSLCTDGYFDELLAASLRQRGVLGLIIEAGVRDVSALTEMKFPVWSAAVSAQGTVKETVGSVQTPVVCGGALINPGDIIVADDDDDDDGVVVVPRSECDDVLKASQERDRKEAGTRQRLEAGELGLDIYSMREKLYDRGLKYIDFSNV